MLLQEGKYISALMAAEAVVHLTIRIHTEGRRLFIMKRTQSDIPPPGLFQPDTGTDQAHNIRRIPDLVDDLIRIVQTSLPPLHPPAAPSLPGRPSAYLLPMSAWQILCISPAHVRQTDCLRVSCSYPADGLPACTYFVSGCPLVLAEPAILCYFINPSWLHFFCQDCGTNSSRNFEIEYWSVIPDM